jgi:hypothetical protein
LDIKNLIKYFATQRSSTEIALNDENPVDALNLHAIKVIKKSLFCCPNKRVESIKQMEILYISNNYIELNSIYGRIQYFDYIKFFPK